MKSLVPKTAKKSHKPNAKREGSDNALALAKRLRISPGKLEELENLSVADLLEKTKIHSIGWGISSSILAQMIKESSIIGLKPVQESVDWNYPVLCNLFARCLCGVSDHLIDRVRSYEPSRFRTLLAEGLMFAEAYMESAGIDFAVPETPIARTYREIVAGKNAAENQS